MFRGNGLRICFIDVYIKCKWCYIFILFIKNDVLWF